MKTHVYSGAKYRMKCEDLIGEEPWVPERLKPHQHHGQLGTECHHICSTSMRLLCMGPPELRQYPCDLKRRHRPGLPLSPGSAKGVPRRHVCARHLRASRDNDEFKGGKGQFTGIGLWGNQRCLPNSIPILPIPLNAQLEGIPKSCPRVWGKELE